MSTSFQDEFREICRRHGLEIDERYSTCEALSRRSEDVDAMAALIDRLEAGF